MRQAAAGLALAVTVAAGITLGSRPLRDLIRRIRRQHKLVQEIKHTILPSKQQLSQIKSDLLKEFNDGLQREVEANGKHMLMLPTYVTRLPNGDETGDVYAIDIGGTNFRVMYVHLADGKSIIDRHEMQSVAIPKEIYTGSGKQLFQFLAKEVVKFMSQHEGCSNIKQGLPPIVGFCWSFPLKQTALNQGILLDWTKGFTCDGVIGNDPVQLLSDALQQEGQPCRVLALLNDTVGVLAANRYLDPDTSVGIIIGTGTNACYVEKVCNVTKWKPGHGVAQDTDTCINIEWGAFDSPALPRCNEDWDVDAATIHKGKYMFEKLLSGMFLGEVVRRILLRLAKDPEAALFGTDAAGPIVPAPLKEQGGFTTAHLASIVDGTPGISCADAIRSALGKDVCVSLSAQYLVRQLCCMVAMRSAQLVACAVHALLEHSGWTLQPKRLAVTFDGGVYKQFAAYRKMLRRSMEEMLGRTHANLVQFALTEDGSCLGAAVLAAAAAAQSA